MRLVDRNDQSLTFDLPPRERELLVFLMRRYPVLDPGYHKIASSSQGDSLNAEQQFLTDSMTEEQNANRQRIDQFIRTRLTPENPDSSATDLLLKLTFAEADWLLRIINDVRVGCWVRLGKPDSDELHSSETASRHVTDFAAMELGGLVQHILLEALQE
jgi:hypothetical protein